MPAADPKTRQLLMDILNNPPREEQSPEPILPVHEIEERLSAIRYLENRFASATPPVTLNKFASAALLVMPIRSIRQINSKLYTAEFAVWVRFAEAMKPLFKNMYVALKTLRNRWPGT